MAGNFHYFDRDLSWLSFNERVLMEAAQTSVPLLERFKFLSIYSSNLDEFYRVRMPAIMAMDRINKKENPDEVYFNVTETITRQLGLFGNILNTQLIPELAQSGYIFLNNEPIPASIDDEITNYFFTHIAGLLKPVAMKDRLAFFPGNNQIYLAVVVNAGDRSDEFYLVNIPTEVLPRFFPVQMNKLTYIVFIEDIIRKNLRFIFKDRIVNAYNIKITRDANLDLTADYDEDVAEKIEKQLRKRDMGLATRFLHQPDIPNSHLRYIINHFNLHSASVVEGGKHHNLKDLLDLPVHDPEFRYKEWQPISPYHCNNNTETLFDKITQADLLIHTPYHQYDSVIRFFNEAAIDADVEEIYTTLYRVAGNSRIAHALISAAVNGCRVTVLVELKARFDEANNIKWAKKMKLAGVKIIYTHNKLKVHAKVALIKRRNKKFPLLGLFATGNFNENTAKFYTDHILLTAHQEMLGELDQLFFFFNKKKKPSFEDVIDFRFLLVSQFNLLPSFISLIDKEIQWVKKGFPGQITIKLNNLEEEVLINKLYEASQAGVTINLLVRGICRLVPALRGQSEKITVRRIVDRYLEHGRIFIFNNNGNVKVYMGSADWMDRNIYNRIEVCFPLYGKPLIAEVQEIIALQFADNVKAVQLDALMNQVPVATKGTAIQSQREIYNLLSK